MISIDSQGQCFNYDSLSDLMLFLSLSNSQNKILTLYFSKKETNIEKTSEIQETIGHSILTLINCKSSYKIVRILRVKCDSSQKKSYDKPRQCIKKQSYHFADKCPYS